MTTLESKIEEVKTVRKKILKDLEEAKVFDSEKRKLPPLTQHLAKQTIRSILPTDEQINGVEAEDYLDKQLLQMGRLRNKAGNLSITENDLANRFLFAGTGYKGQMQSGYSVLGGGLTAAVSIDPGKILGLGLVSTKIDVSAGAKRAKQLLLVVQAHPFELLSGSRTDQPITLHAMYGVLWEGELGSSLFVGVEAENPFDTSINVSEATGIDDGDSILAPALSMEIVALDMEARAGLDAQASYTYQNICLLDDTPTYYTQELSVVREGLKPLFKFAEDESTVKKNAIEFQNEYKKYFTKEDKYVKILFVERWASTVAGWLKIGLDNPDTPTEVKEKAKHYLSLLKPFYDSIPEDADSFLALSSHEPSGKAGLFAEAGVSGSVLGQLVSAEAQSRLDALKFSGRYKKAHFRYQSKTPLGTAPQPVLHTQDTTITYGQVDFTPIALAASAKAEVTEVSLKSEDSLKPEISQETIFDWQLDECLAENDIRSAEIKYVLHNSMRYDSVSMYWQKPALGVEERTSNTLTLLPGSGVSFGSSLSILSLVNLSDFDPIGDRWQYEETAKLAEALARKLYVSVEDIKTFITQLDTEFHGLKKYLKDLQVENGLSAVLVESNFDVADETVDFVSEDSRVGIDKESVKTLMSDFVSNQEKGTPKKPQAMRLRYRLADNVESDSTEFKLGFKILDTGTGIELNSVDRVGAEGIIDLATIWFEEELSKLSVKDPDAAREHKLSVPPVALFCQ